MADVYATRDLDYDDAGWDYEDEGELVDPKAMTFEEVAEMLHEHNGDNEVISREYSLYVSAEFPDGEWESTYLERYVTISVSDCVRQMEKRYQQMIEQRDLFKNRAELFNEKLETLMAERDAARERADLAEDALMSEGLGEKYSLGENPND